MFSEEYAQYYGQMTMKRGGGNGAAAAGKGPEGLPYEEMGYCPPPNRKLPPVPGQHSNYNTIDRIKNGKKHMLALKDELHNSSFVRECALFLLASFLSVFLGFRL